MAEIRLQGITKIFDKKVRAVDDVELTIADREFMVLLGPSGCGKTTLMRMIAGLEYPEQGRITIGGRDVTDLPPRKRDIAMVFQSYAVFPHLTVFENIGFGLRMKKRPKAEVKERVEAAAALVQLSPFLARYPAQLSGGQRQRVAVARAIVMEPSVLLMDEPLSNLDALLRLNFRADLKKLVARLQTTTIYVTHDQVEALSLGDRIAVMRDGRIVQVGTPIEVYDRPATEFVGGFIGNPPMNFLRGRLDGQNGRLHAAVGEHMLAAPAALGGMRGREVVIGIRAENIEASSEPVANGLTAQVDVVEPLGSHLLVTAAVGEQRVKVVARADATIQLDDRLWLRPEPDKLRWYDAESGNEVETPVSDIGRDGFDARAMAEAAAGVLRQNDLGGWTKAAPRLYPHQWSWDSAFIAIGWAQLDPLRAAEELRTLFAAQWATGQVPHIVFNPAVPPGGYFPDPSFWDCARLSPDVPAGRQTSGLVQPPVHGIAAWRIREVARRQGHVAGDEVDAFLREIYPRLFAWHRYLLTRRDPEGSGLVTVYHPWESADNSPRFDAAMAAVEVGELPPYQRFDLTAVADPSTRPTMEEYDRYLWLVELLKKARYDDTAVQVSYPLLIKDVFFSGILVAANEALLRIAKVAGAPQEERQSIARWIELGRRVLDRAWDVDLGLCVDQDVRAGQSVRVRTFGGFAPLIAGGLPAERQAALLATFDSPAFVGNPELRWPLPPSTSPLDPAFRPRSYWRGPTWPVITWLLWWALVRAGEQERAARLRRAGLEQLAAVGFAEYVEPFTGEPLGSPEQSWTAAVALDWLGAGVEGEAG